MEPEMIKSIYEDILKFNLSIEEIVLSVDEFKMTRLYKNLVEFLNKYKTKD